MFFGVLKVTDCLFCGSQFKCTIYYLSKRHETIYATVTGTVLTQLYTFT